MTDAKVRIVEAELTGNDYVRAQAQSSKSFRQVRSQKNCWLDMMTAFLFYIKTPIHETVSAHMRETVNFSTGCSAIISAFLLLANELFVRHAFFIAIRVIIFLWLFGIKVKGQVRGVHYDCRARWSKTNKKPGRKGFATWIRNVLGTLNRRQDSFSSNFRRRSQNVAAAITALFLLLLLVGTGLGIIDGQTLNALRPLVETLVESQQFYPSETLLTF